MNAQVIVALTLTLDDNAIEEIASGHPNKTDALVGAIVPALVMALEKMRDPLAETGVALELTEGAALLLFPDAPPALTLDWSFLEDMREIVLSEMRGTIPDAVGGTN